jgi:hypothetical protein
MIIYDDAHAYDGNVWSIPVKSMIILTYSFD